MIDRWNNAELYHYGILGMKWGVRRYQNKDGSLTSAGKKRYSLNADKLQKNRTNINETRNHVRTINSSIDKRHMKKIDSWDLSSMSDDELRRRVNRYNLERQYKNSFSEEYKTSGMKRVQQILSYADEALVVASSAVSLALLIDKIKRKA